MFFTNVQHINTIEVDGKTIHILTGLNNQLKANTCLALKDLLMDGQHMKYAMVFYTPYWERMPEQTKDFVINHEIGHIVNDHHLSPTQFIKNELEADAYAIAAGVKPEDAIAILEELFAVALPNLDKWIFRFITRIERFVRIQAMKKLAKG